MDQLLLDLDQMLKRLNLANARRIWQDLVRKAEEEEWGFTQFLTTLMAEEIAHRQQTRLRKLTRRAKFPFLKTIDDFDFTFQTSLKQTMLGSYLSPEFVVQGRNLILLGRPGRGKTHLAIAIAYKAIQNGFDALFTTATALIGHLSTALQNGQLAQTLHLYVQPGVLVIDEMGYLSYGPDAANILFHVVNERYLKSRPILFTTNKPLKLWGNVLHDPDLAEAIIDRILERGRLIILDGPSYRTRDQKIHLDFPDQLDSVSGARFSGISTPKYTEPACCNSHTNSTF